MREKKNGTACRMVMKYHIPTTESTSHQRPVRTDNWIGPCNRMGRGYFDETTRRKAKLHSPPRIEHWVMVFHEALRGDRVCEASILCALRLNLRRDMLWSALLGTSQLFCWSVSKAINSTVIRLSPWWVFPYCLWFLWSIRVSFIGPRVRGCRRYSRHVPSTGVLAVMSSMGIPVMLDDVISVETVGAAGAAAIQYSANALCIPIRKLEQKEKLPSYSRIEVCSMTRRKH